MKYVPISLCLLMISNFAWGMESVRFEEAPIDPAKQAETPKELAKRKEALAQEKQQKQMDLEKSVFQKKFSQEQGKSLKLADFGTRKIAFENLETFFKSIGTRDSKEYQAYVKAMNEIGFPVGAFRTAILDLSENEDLAVLKDNLLDVIGHLQKTGLKTSENVKFTSRYFETPEHQEQLLGTLSAIGRAVREILPELQSEEFNISTPDNAHDILEQANALATSLRTMPFSSLKSASHIKIMLFMMTMGMVSLAISITLQVLGKKGHDNELVRIGSYLQAASMVCMFLGATVHLVGGMKSHLQGTPESYFLLEPKAKTAEPSGPAEGAEPEQAKQGWFSSVKSWLGFSKKEKSA